MVGAKDSVNENLLIKVVQTDTRYGELKEINIIIKKYQNKKIRIPAQFRI